MKKETLPDNIKKYTSQKGKHPAPKPPTKMQKVMKWLSNNWIALLSLLVAIIALLKG